MADYRLSRRAASDLEAIADYTIEQFGVAQARRYRDSLRLCFEQISDNPRMGRRAEQLSPGLRRFEHRSHVVFYTRSDDEVFIVRILHARMHASRAQMARADWT